jgi:hypothetical protein
LTKLTVNIFSIWQQLVVGYFLLWSEAQLSRPAGLQNKQTPKSLVCLNLPDPWHFGTRTDLD